MIRTQKYIGIISYHIHEHKKLRLNEPQFFIYGIIEPCVVLLADELLAVLDEKTLGVGINAHTERVVYEGVSSRTTPPES